MAKSFRAKICMAVLDIIIALIGLGLFVVGIWLYLQSGLLTEFVVKLFNNIEYQDIKLGYMLKTITLMMCIVGGLMMLVALLGICGGWKMIKGCIVLYILFVVLLILIQAVLAGLLVSYHSKTDSWLRGQMLRVFKDYKGPHGDDDVSRGWNSLFRNARCCSVSYNSEFSTTTWWASRGSDVIPASCCQGVEVDEVAGMVGSSCTTTPMDYYNTSCYERIEETIRALLIIVCTACFITIVTEIASLVVGCVIIDHAKNRVRQTGPIRGPQKNAPPYIGIDSVMKNKR